MPAYRDITEALPDLMHRVLVEGAEVPSRNGATRELLHQHITLTEPWRREVLTPGRKASLPAQIAETMWVLAGRDDVEWLGRYLPRAGDFSDDGLVWRGAYGKRLRAWGSTDYRVDNVDPIDQLAAVIFALKQDPGTRRAVMSMWDPELDTDGSSKDIPCNNWLHFQIRDGRLYLHVTIRSNDLMWGWSGINAFEWSALQEIVAGILGVEIGELHFSISSLHLYDRHWAKAGKIAGASPVPPLPSGSPRFAGGPDWDIKLFDALVERWFVVEERIRLGNFDPDIIDNFPEPMLRSWLNVLAWHWTRNETFLVPLVGTPLYAAAMLTPKPVQEDVNKLLDNAAAARQGAVPQTVMAGIEGDPFIEFVVQLHAEKNAVYGDSWKRRGEVLGILANIARKVDRLGVGGAGDTAADTVIDLLVYLVKYRHWMQRPDDDDPTAVEARLRSLPTGTSQPGGAEAETAFLVSEFNDLEQDVQNNDGVYSSQIVSRMIEVAAPLARYLWTCEQYPQRYVMGHAERNETRAWNPEA